MRYHNGCVNIRQVLEQMGANPAYRSVAAGSLARTLWHSLYDQQAGTVEISFYLGDEANLEGTRRERRTEYLRFGLPAHGRSP